MSDQLLRLYIKKLEKHATPTVNDKRHLSYVQYINAFLSLFGKERVVLVGSTAEKLKLRTSKFGGDADFLLCSGRLEIPIDNLEEREDCPCYVKIRADNLRSDACSDSIDGYLSADILRGVRPELFTILRAMYTEVTSTADTIPGRESRVTTIGVPMKVGLARTEFRNLKIEGDVLPPKRSNKRLNVDRTTKETARLKKRWQKVRLNMSDMKIIQRILKIVRMGRVPGSKGEGYGQINYFADLLDSVMQRTPLEQEENSADDDEPSEDKEARPDILDESAENGSGQKMKATYSDMTKKDFVPTLKLIGNRKLRCMVEWRKRVEKASWPPRNVVEEIFKSDVFAVAREAPVNPDSRRDFCLSFNLAEIMLGQCLTTVQRRVYLILKSYLSGLFQSRHMALDLELKLKTYYLKTAFFWVCERENPTIWTEDNIIEAVKTVLLFLQQCVKEKKLSHYFVNSNLFADLDDLACDVLQHCIQEALDKPVQSIGEFKFIDDHSDERCEIWLTADELQSLEELKEDGGRFQHLNKLEDALIDLQRGFNEGPRDANGNSPIKEAVLKALDVFLEEERQRERTNEASNISPRDNAATFRTQPVPRGNVSQTTAIAGLLNQFVNSGANQTVNTRESNERMNILLGLGSMIPGGSEFIAEIGGREGVRNLIEQSASQETDHGLELRNAIDRYLSCNAEEEDGIALELKQKLTAYFIGRKEIL